MTFNARMPMSGRNRRGWGSLPQGMTPEALVAFNQAADRLCRAALATAARLKDVLPGVLDEELRQAAADYAAAAAAIDKQLGSR